MRGPTRSAPGTAGRAARAIPPALPWVSYLLRRHVAAEGRQADDQEHDQLTFGVGRTLLVQVEPDGQGRVTRHLGRFHHALHEHGHAAGRVREVPQPILIQCPLQLGSQFPQRRTLLPIAPAHPR